MVPGHRKVIHAIDGVLFDVRQQSRSPRVSQARVPLFGKLTINIVIVVSSQADLPELFCVRSYIKTMPDPNSIENNVIILLSKNI